MMKQSQQKGLVELEVQVNNEIEMYDIKDVQRILKIGRNNVYKLLKLPTFPVIKIGNKYIIPRAEFEQWVHKSIHKKYL